MARLDNTERARRMAERIATQVVRGAGKGMNAARVFIVSRIKETLSVPAPRTRVTSGPGSLHPGEVYYRATTRATVGAPPRKLSGRMRSSVTSQAVSTILPGHTAGQPKSVSHRRDYASMTAVIGVSARGMPSSRYPLGFPYPRYHEAASGDEPGSGKHPYLRPTLDRWCREIRAILGKEVQVTLSRVM